MYQRCIAAGLLLWPATAAHPTQKPLPKTSASVKLWLESGADNSCEKSMPASGDWMIRNNEGRNVVVTLRRVMSKDGATREDQMHDTLGPRESRELGCAVTDEGQQTLTLVRAVY